MSLYTTECIIMSCIVVGLQYKAEWYKWWIFWVNIASVMSLFWYNLLISISVKIPWWLEQKRTNDLRFAVSSFHGLLLCYIVIEFKWTFGLALEYEINPINPSMPYHHTIDVIMKEILYWAYKDLCSLCLREHNYMYLLWSRHSQLISANCCAVQTFWLWIDYSSQIGRYDLNKYAVELWCFKSQNLMTWLGRKHSTT